MSPNLLRMPADWPGNVHLCGQWLARSPAWTPAPELMNFLAAGDAPVYIGFGSMTGFDSARLLDALIEAIAGRRALFHPGWSGVDPKAFRTTFSSSATPARLAVPMHLGGHPSRRIGNLTLRRKRRCAIHRDSVRRRPIFLGRTLAPGRCRVGPCPWATAEADAFAKALDFAAGAGVRNRARALGETMRTENGVAVAVAALERVVAG